MLVAVVIAVLYALLAWHSGKQFERLYGVYEKAETDYITAANKPAADTNPIRQTVNVLLAQVLQVEMTPSVRLEKAKQGIAHLNDMEGQIDGIKTEADRVIPMLDALEKASHTIATVQAREKTGEIISLGRRQVEIISDIRGLSYRADYYTDEVFERIIDDGGAMTDAHKLYLNELIPQLEQQFDQRSNLYTELKTNDEKMQTLADELGYKSE